MICSSTTRTTSSLLKRSQEHTGESLRNERTTKMPKVHVLDYISGNVRSLHNAIEKLGWEVEFIKDPSEIALAEVR